MAKRNTKTASQSNMETVILQRVNEALDDRENSGIAYQARLAAIGAEFNLSPSDDDAIAAILSHDPTERFKAGPRKSEAKRILTGHAFYDTALAAYNKHVAAVQKKDKSAKFNATFDVLKIVREACKTGKLPDAKWVSANVKPRGAGAGAKSEQEKAVATIKSLLGKDGVDFEAAVKAAKEELAQPQPSSTPAKRTPSRTQRAVETAAPQEETEMDLDAILAQVDPNTKTALLAALLGKR